MTIFPEHPHLESAPPRDGLEFRRLVEDHVTAIDVILGWSLLVIVKAGYETDGATVSISKSLPISGSDSEKLATLIKKYFPSEDVMSVYNRLVGTPWDLPRLLAAVVHDALYSIKWKCRFLCDRVYKWILKATDYDVVRREIEYDAIRLVGWQSWNNVTKGEWKWAKKLVIVKWVRTKKVPAILEKLKTHTKEVK